MIAHTVVTLFKAIPCAMKNGCMRGMTFLEGDNLVTFYNLSASEIWPDNRVTSGGSSLMIEVLLNKKSLTSSKNKKKQNILFMKSCYWYI